MADYPWLPHVKRAVQEIEARYNWATGGTYPGHDPSEARAADFWSTSKAQHDQLFHWVINNHKRLNVMYIISWRRIWSDARSAEGIRPYTRYVPPASASQLHTNHVHISFDPFDAEPSQSNDEGFPIMAGKSVPIQENYKDQALTTKSGYVRVADNRSSVVQGESDGVECVASVEVDGLQDGEFVKIWWNRVWKKTGSDDSSRSSEIADYASFAEPTAHVTYADKLAKADSGWTACLRVRYETNSDTAVINKFTANGWKLT